MKEEDIRKRDVFNRYLELVREDSKKFFSDSTSFTKSNCFACEGFDLEQEFEKHGFKYVSCRNCSTLFVNPRPSFRKLNDFYENSESAKFWINEFFAPVAEARRKEIFSPRAEYVHNNFLDKEIKTIGDIGAGFGIFLEELKNINSDARYIAIEPSVEQAEICRNKGLEVECCALEEMERFKDEFDLLTAFELIEHLFNPKDFFTRVRALLKQGGYLLITTLNGQGFDIQLLWKNSKSVYPPHHLNFFNPCSISLLLEKRGFEVVNVSTPGKLDWDIVEGGVREEGMDAGRFWNFVAEEGSPDCKRELQNWIAKNNLSSHMRIVARAR
jgi:SAM-dependent methyltransferase